MVTIDSLYKAGLKAAFIPLQSGLQLPNNARLQPIPTLGYKENTLVPYFESSKEVLIRCNCCKIVLKKTFCQQ